MIPKPRPGVYDWKLLGFAAALLVLAASALAVKCLVSPDVTFLINGPNAAWIKPSAFFDLVWIDPAAPPAPAVYEKEFFLRDGVKSVTLRARALRGLGLFINEAPVPAEALRTANWKKEIRLELIPYLRPGKNLLRAEVRNPSGPPALALSLEGLGYRWATDKNWKVRTGEAAPERAQPADDTRPGPMEFLKLRGVLAEKWPVLAVLFALSFVAYLLGSFLLPAQFHRHLPLAALAVFSFLWVWAFAMKIYPMPLEVGYDVKSHLYVLKTLINEHRLPVPLRRESFEEFAVYHPPLFYLLGAGLVELSKYFTGGAGEMRLLKLIPFLSGLGNLWLVWAAARRIFRENRLNVLFAVLAAGIIPMNFFLASYISNEALHGFLANAAICLAAGLLMDAEGRPGRFALTGIVLGLAFITKLTAVVVIGVTVPFLILDLVLRKSRPSAAVLRLGLLGGALAAVAAAYLLRNLSVFGHLLPEQGVNRTMWQSPGFHTARYFLEFGVSLSRPFFSSLSSFWDGLYSTFWGDAFLSDISEMKYWNYPFMLLGYVLALPATMVMLLGVLQSAAAVFRRDNDPAVRKVMAYFTALLAAFGFFILNVVLICPYWSLPKAFYGLFTLVPLSVMGATGFRLMHDLLSGRGRVWARALFYGGFGTLAGAVYLSYLS